MIAFASDDGVKGFVRPSVCPFVSHAFFCIAEIGQSKSANLETYNPCATDSAQLIHSFGRIDVRLFFVFIYQFKTDT